MKFLHKQEFNGYLKKVAAINKSYFLNIFAPTWQKN